MTDTVLYEQVGAKAILTLNRPAKLNALNYTTLDRLLALLDQIEANPAICAVILTGARTAFCATHRWRPRASSRL